MPPIHILWIEDEALYQLNALMGPVLFNYRTHNLELATTASDAQKFLCNSSFDVIIVDMRIPPGENPTWKNIYKSQGNDKNKARLGAYLIQWMIGHLNGLSQELPILPHPIPAHRIAIFTAEEAKSVQNLLNLGISVYQPKDSNYPDDILIRIAARVLQNSKVQ
jgi:CheY-like chemotaxis protein